MNRLVLVSGLAMISGLALAQEVGRVISSTPVTREVGVPQRQCAPDARPDDACRSVTHFERRTIGYNVVYEYAGKQYTTQLPEDPGAIVNLQISPAGASRSAAPSAPTTATPIYEERWDADRDRPYRILRTTEGWDADRDRGVTETIVTGPRVVERVYVSPDYYPGPYYYPSYYGSTVFPLIGLSIGLSRGYGGYYGHRWR